MGQFTRSLDRLLIVSACSLQDQRRRRQYLQCKLRGQEEEPEKGRRTNEPFSNIAPFVYRVRQLEFTSFLADYFAPHTVQGLCILFNI